ncbi:saccharopine dehydrogenase family protein [Halogeometricum borinquense]|uniref:saccharopine dehydrogenase family protein n=1 Tax=Halogeometricum borinquense TaxID=60847 RepID=UPI003427CEEE
MSDDSRFLVYGAYGYTGRLIAEEAADRDLDVVLAGRDEKRTRDVANELDLPNHTFDVSQAATMLDDVSLVLNCAGPFDETADHMVDACIETETHYLDITGEIPVFERIKRRSDEADEAGITLLPGVGFDVVPTDCLAAHLKSRLPEATHLTLALESDGSISPGTLKTALGDMSGGGAVRRDGDLRWVPVGHKTRAIDFGEGLHRAVTIPWGDVSTAYVTTEIPNIEVYLSLPSKARSALTGTSLLGGLLDTKPAQSMLQRAIERYVEGPDERERESSEARIWGEARSSTGRVVSRLRTPNTYAITVQTALLCAQKTLNGEAPTGYQTPAAAFGPDLILEIPGVERIDLKDDEIIARETGAESDEAADGEDAEAEVALDDDAVTIDLDDDEQSSDEAEDAADDVADTPSPRPLSDEAEPVIRRRETEAETAEAETVESETAESETAEAETAEAETAESETAEEAVEAEEAEATEEAEAETTEGEAAAEE